MLRKKKMAAEIVRLTYRVQELEERLCPCEQHQWIVIDMESVYDPRGVDPKGLLDQKSRVQGALVYAFYFLFFFGCRTVWP